MADMIIGTNQYDYNTLIRLSAEKDRTKNLQLSVFAGGVSLVVWDDEKRGGPVVKFGVTGFRTGFLKAFLRRAIAAGPDFKSTININDWNNVDKKTVPLGTLVIGRDDKGIIYIGVSTPAVKAKFLIQGDLRWDVSDSLSVSEQSTIAAEELITQIEHEVAVAKMNSKFKRDNPMRDGRGGGAGGNGSRPSPSQNTDLDDEIAF